MQESVRRRGFAPREKSALDVTTATLDGFLEIVFGMQPVEGIFDLIISDAFDGLFGDFTSVSVTGLAMGATYTTGFDIAYINNQDVEVYRLIVDGVVTTVPEPASLTLLVIGACGLWQARQRQ